MTIKVNIENRIAKAAWVSVFLLLLMVSGCQPTASTDRENQNQPGEAVEDRSGNGQVVDAGNRAVADNGAREKTDSSASADSWWYFRGDATATGFIKTDRLPKTLDVVWEFEAEKTAFEGSPVAKDGKLILADLDGKIWCLDLVNGKEIWSVESKVSYIASPTLADDGIYVGDSDGYFHRFNWEGKEDWTFEAGAQIDSAANFYRDWVVFGSQDSILYCLNRKDGSEVWQHRTDDQIRCSIVVAGNQTYVAGCDGRLHVVNLDDGSAVGEVPLGAVTGSTPATKGERVYFGLEDGQFLCIDVQAGKTVWYWQDSVADAAIRGSAAVSDDKVVFGNRAGKVLCLNLEDGKEIWVTEVDRKVDGSPLVVGERVFVGDGSGMLLVLDLKTGEKLQELELTGAVLGSPCLLGDRLIVATDEGMVYCLGKR